MTMLVTVQGEEEYCANINGGEPFNELRDQNIAEINGQYSFEIKKKKNVRQNDS